MVNLSFDLEHTNLLPRPGFRQGAVHAVKYIRLPQVTYWMLY